MHICCAGEVMVEMAAAELPGHYLRGIAGDTYNTAVYLARAGLDVSYLTRLGDDRYSDEIIASLAAEGIATERIGRSPGRTPGLYVIDNDADGERHFSYWRAHSPAREIFLHSPGLAGVDVFYFSGITLATNSAQLEQLCAALQKLRGDGCRVIFDPNYRPALWRDAGEARHNVEAVLPLCDVALPTLADERDLFGVADVQECLQLYQAHGIEEVVIKADDLTAHAVSGEQNVSLRAEQVAAIDTTGAGDAFSAGYLAQRLKGGDLEASLRAAQQLAAAVVQHRGAILPRAAQIF